jgi:hypothetical protein
MIVAVVCAFAICWLPIHIILVMKSLNMYQVVSKTLVAFQIISHVLAYTNSCINPILYCFLSENFRKAFRKVSKLIFTYLNNITTKCFLLSHRSSIVGHNAIFKRKSQRKSYHDRATVTKIFYNFQMLKFMNQKERKKFAVCRT